MCVRGRLVGVGDERLTLAAVPVASDGLGSRG